MKKYVDWKTCFRIAATIFLLYLCIHYWDHAADVIAMAAKALAPLLMGCAIAYVINIPMGFYEKHYFPRNHSKAVAGSRRCVCMIAAYLSIFFLAFMVIRMFIPELVSCVKTLMARIPFMINQLLENDTVLQWLPQEWAAYLLDFDWNNLSSGILDFLESGLAGHGEAVVNLISTIVTNVINWVVGLVFSAYLLLGKEKIRDQIGRLARAYIRSGRNRKIGYVLSVFNDSFHNFIVGQCKEAVILGSLCALGMAILKIPYAAMVGVLVGFTALIPIIGAYIGAIAGALLILSESPMKALVFLVFIIVLQQMEGAFIYPKVVGSSIGLPGLWVFAVVIVGGGIGGIPGILLGVPTASALYRLLRVHVCKKEMEKNNTGQEPVDEDEKL